MLCFAEAAKSPIWLAPSPADYPVPSTEQWHSLFSTAVHTTDNSPLLLSTKHILLAVQNVTTHTRQIRNKVEIDLYGNFKNAWPLDNYMGDHS